MLHLGRKWWRTAAEIVAPARDYSGLGAQERGETEGKRGGGRGDFIEVEKEGNPGRNGADSPGGIAGRNFVVAWLEVEGGDVIADVRRGTRVSLAQRQKKNWRRWEAATPAELVGCLRGLAQVSAAWLGGAAALFYFFGQSNFFFF